ncbi:MAG: hypothetical protein D6760_12740 [Deltaproteobacteria bacterium]|nr:MAG: hypothetical protein D6760_12740 [Deltaproteobacteria bacterium]
MAGDFCGEVGCPVQKRRPLCPGTCGNAFLDWGEACDDGPSGSSSCYATCTPRGCGNGIVEPGEACDDRGETTACDSDCTPVECGDGLINHTAGEQCDDGNTSAGDGCAPNCRIEGCGNGLIEGTEVCDDAGESATCDVDCTRVVCGDGLVNVTAGEECEGNPGSVLCEDRGFSTGSIACDSNDCTLDTSGCVRLAYRCAVGLTLASSQTLGALQYEVDYSSASGEFFRRGGDVACTSSLPQVLSVFNDHDATRTLVGGAVSTLGFTGPVDLATCRFDTDQADTNAAQFRVSVVDASTLDLFPTNATVAVKTVTCGQNTTTTTLPPTTTTTTTLPPGKSKKYDVVFHLDDAVTLGALQYQVDYSDAYGQFLGLELDAQCTNLINGSLFAFNNDLATQTLVHGVITLSGIRGPTSVARCVFKAQGRKPVASDFHIVVEDATGLDLLPVDVTVSVSAIHRR